ncbi:MAG TPA: NAD(P)/FAD-dependent oxidoreductase [Pseudonocardia sp.]|jgi:cyclohexanone monooxygenase
MEGPVRMQADLTSEIVIIGAGPSGICMGIKLKEAGFGDFVILEKASDVGGTWRDSTYPGLTVDIPVLTYSFSFEQKPDWSSLWAPQRELYSYLRHCAEKYQLQAHLRFDREVVDARYDEEKTLWVIRTGDGSEYRSRYMVNASGFLSVPKWPDFDGLEEFQGKKVHTSAWTDDLDLDGDRIAFVGTGATGIQLAPELAPIAGQLHVFQRTPIWLLPKPPMPVPAVLQRVFRLVPGVQRVARLLTAAFMDLVFWRAFTNYGQVRLLAAAVEKLARGHIRTQVEDPGVAERLTPRYSWGCKRPSFSNKFYPIFNRENVELVTEPIERLTPKGIVTRDGTERPIDALICATGYQPFEKAALPTYPVAGRGGQQLAEYWDAHRYQAFRGFAVHGFPNYFMVFGPYSIASTSYIAMIELQVRNIIRVLRAARSDGADYVEVRKDAQAADFEATLRKKKTAIWTVANCGSSNSFYYDRFGDTPGFRPTYHYREWWAARTLSASHFHLEKRAGRVRA